MRDISVVVQDVCVWSAAFASTRAGSRGAVRVSPRQVLAIAAAGASPSALYLIDQQQLVGLASACRGTGGLSVLPLLLRFFLTMHGEGLETVT